MTNALLQIKIKQRLNKLSSLDYDNIECWQVMEAFNKAQLEWVRRALSGMNTRREGDEQTKRSVDSLQVLLTSGVLSPVQKADYYEAPLPKDYLEFKRVSASAKNDCCPPRPLSVYLTEEGRVDSLLHDALSGPSFEWAETFCTLAAGKVRIWTAGGFTVPEARITYYRTPRQVAFKGCTDPATGTLVTKEVLCEFSDGVCELIADEAAAILAGDFESMAQLQRNLASGQRNS